MGVRVRPTGFGVAATAVALAVVVARSSVSDPAASAVVWTAFVALIGGGAVWPVVSMARARVERVDLPSEIVRGRPAPLTLRVRVGGLADYVLVRVGRSEDPWSVPVGTDAEVALTVPRRAILGSLPVSVSTDGPLGMVVVSRTFDVSLPRPVAVGPEPVPTAWAPPVVPESGPREHLATPTGSGDQVRSVRPYRSGDPAHLVHWPSSARAGTLVVRELEPPVRSGVVIVVELPTPAEGEDPDPAAERSVDEAAGLALGVLAGGGEVVLCTCEEGTAVAAVVFDRRQVHRRLAAAGPGSPGAVPLGDGGAWRTICRFGAGSVTHG